MALAIAFDSISRRSRGTPLDMNEELVNDLLANDYIRSPDVEKAFRLVNRCNYILSHYSGYFKSAWRHGKLHLSAASIYGVVMEGLELKSGLSFLNIGSGTGYLSTMVGLIIGPHGINHGVEIYDEVVDYAYKKLEAFKTSRVADVYDFAEPKFLKGNGLCLPPDLPGYDRIYVGAGCTREHRDYLKRLLNVGGILIVPIESSLLKIKRKSQNHWKRDQFLLSVTFANIINSTDEDKTLNAKPLSRNPLTLETLCRISIKSILRKNVDKKTKELIEYFKENVATYRQRHTWNYVSDSDDDDEDSNVFSSKIRLGFSNLKRTFEEVSFGDLGDSFFGILRTRNNLRSNAPPGEESTMVEDSPASSPDISVPSISVTNVSRLSLLVSTSSDSSEDDFEMRHVRSESSLSLSSAESDLEITDTEKIVKPPSLMDKYLEDYVSKLMELINELPLPLPLKKFINNDKDIELKSQDVEMCE